MPLDFPNPSVSTTYTDPTSGNTYIYANGSWSIANLLPASKGGTGFASYTRGDILFGNVSGTLSKLAAGTSGYVLSTNGSGADPTWIAQSGSGQTIASSSDATVAVYSGAGTSIKGSSGFTINGSTGTVNIDMNDTTYAFHIRGSGNVSKYRFDTDNSILHLSAGSGKSSELRLYTGDYTYYTGFKPNATANKTYILPSTTPASGTSVLQSDTSGNLTWVAMTASGGGAGTVATPGAQYQIAGYYSGSGASVTGSSSFTNDTSNNIVSITHPTSSISTTSGALVVTGGVGIGGSLYAGALSKFSDHVEIKTQKELRLYNSGDTFYTALKAGAVASSSKTFTLPINYGSTGQFLYTTDTSGTMAWRDDPIQVNSASINQVAYYSSAGSSVYGSSTFTNDTSTNKVSITHTTASGSTTSGALVVSGGVGIGGSLYVGTGNVSTGFSTGDLVVLGGVGVSGALRIGDTTVSSSVTTGALTVRGGVGIGGTLYVGSGIAAVSTTTGDVVVTGGAGIGGSLRVGDSTNTGSTVTGALVVAGGVGVGGGIYVGSTSQFSGNLTIQGSLTMNAPLQAFNLTSPFKKINSISLSMSGNGWTNGAIIQVQQANIKETSAATNATVSNIVPAVSFRKQSFSATNSGVTFTKAVNVYIEDAPDSSVTNASGAGSTNTVTLTNSYALYIENGRTYMGGALDAPGTYRCSIGLATNQTITTGTDTVVSFTSINDPNSWWNATTKKFTPTIAGWYFIQYQVNWAAASITNAQCNIQARKNGTTFSIGMMQLLSGNAYSMSCSGMVNLNGTTDYLDFTVYTANTTSQVLTGESNQQYTRVDIFKIQ